MKYLSLLVLSFTVVGLGVLSTGCGPEPTKPITPTTDTTDTTENPVIRNEFKIGFDKYELHEIKSLTYGVYNAAADRTYISVSGNDPEDGDAEFFIEFNGKEIGTRTNHTTTGNLVVEVATGTKGDVRREEFRTVDGSDNFIITITEYNAVGGVIKGSFGGKIKKLTNSYDITGGKFEVNRRDDE